MNDLKNKWEREQKSCFFLPEMKLLHFDFASDSGWRMRKKGLFRPTEQCEVTHMVWAQSESSSTAHSFLQKLQDSLAVSIVLECPLKFLLSILIENALRNQGKIKRSLQWTLRNPKWHHNKSRATDQDHARIRESLQKWLKRSVEKTIALRFCFNI